MDYRALARSPRVRASAVTLGEVTKLFHPASNVVPATDDALPRRAHAAREIARAKASGAVHAVKLPTLTVRINPQTDLETKP